MGQGGGVGGCSRGVSDVFKFLGAKKKGGKEGLESERDAS